MCSRRGARPRQLAVASLQSEHEAHVLIKPVQVYQKLWEAVIPSRKPWHLPIPVPGSVRGDQQQVSLMQCDAHCCAVAPISSYAA